MLVAVCAAVPTASTTGATFRGAAAGGSAGVTGEGVDGCADVGADDCVTAGNCGGAAVADGATGVGRVPVAGCPATIGVVSANVVAISLVACRARGDSA